jgi:hypothetical protein
MSAVDRIRLRYFRRAMSSPRGRICHHGDCRVFVHKVCTCGLLHDLTALGDGEAVAGLYPAYAEEDAAQHAVLGGLYPPHDQISDARPEPLRPDLGVLAQGLLGELGDAEIAELCRLLKGGKP